ncbi:glycosyl transferase, group 1 [Pseudonocardia sp. Ae168_Ps1]|nr:glycosyl transferase, group 1 [Pseudonocardia sp. Ae150A_Ps1]OLL79597.1 glycosyl transferase, group 1 [Pseudonocardia sp. Ae168_Ps1]OLL86267.1 glycosyl transferase, group 1 [Pseudonocardia sp. Ae263_Ps1]OLL93701.1 glycosyl transferase, group 1 [Pseudonocardia sp. Ae356_Ps1]
MRVLLASKFLHRVGGVETYLEWLADELTTRGHEVALFGMEAPSGSSPIAPGSPRFETPARSYTSGSLRERLDDAASSVYSVANGRRMAAALEQFAPDVVHFHGTCYQLTSAVVRAAGGRGIGRVVTAHEYKLVCANQRLWADSTSDLCQVCVGASPVRRAINPVRRRCIKGSLGASAVGGVETIVSDRIMRGAGDMIVHCPSRFMEQTLHADGWSPARTEVLDLPWRETPHRRDAEATGLLYMGRLAPEKDVLTVLQAWKALGTRTGDRILTIAGTGADEPQLHRYVAEHAVDRVCFVGHLTPDQIGATLRTTAATLHPAIWFENSPFSVRESLMARVPALVADRGGMPELVTDGMTGMVSEHSVAGWSGTIERFLGGEIASPQAFEEELADRVTSGDQHFRALTGLYGRAQAAAAIRTSR